MLATCCARQCCDLLRLNVAIVWPELAEDGPTMLVYVALRCCYSLVRTLTLARSPTWRQESEGKQTTLQGVKWEFISSMNFNPGWTSVIKAGIAELPS